MGFWVLYFDIVLQVIPWGSGCCILTLCYRLHPWVLGALRQPGRLGDGLRV